VLCSVRRSHRRSCAKIAASVESKFLSAIFETLTVSCRVVGGLSFDSHRSIGATDWNGVGFRQTLSLFYAECALCSALSVARTVVAVPK
jgi:hypothetical protein